LFFIFLILHLINSTGPLYGNCYIFPPGDEWNRDVSNDAVDPLSNCYISTQFTGNNVHLDFGDTESNYGIPYSLVPGTQPAVTITYGTDGNDYSDESDPGPYKFPLNAPIEGQVGSVDPTGGDRHLISLDTDNCILYELFDTVRTSDGFECSSAAIFNLSVMNYKLPAGWTSADAAGMPIFPGLLKFGEANSTNGITHAVRFTLPSAPPAYTYPGNHFGPSNQENTYYPPYGTRFRLKANFDETPYSGPSLAIVQGLKKYGMFFADQGSALFITGTTNIAWTDTIDRINTASKIPGNAFEAVVPPFPVVRYWTPSSSSLQCSSSSSHRSGTTSHYSAINFLVHTSWKFSMWMLNTFFIIIVKIITN